MNKKTFNVKHENYEFEIKYGDIFQEKGLKVIPFNRHFDTIVNEDIISKDTLNGKFINKYYKDNVEELDEKIKEELDKLNIIYCAAYRKNHEGNDFIVQHGTTIKANDFLLTALTDFTPAENKAYLTLPSYVSFLIRFWKNISKHYNNSDLDIVMPVIGDGITRFWIGYEKVINMPTNDLILLIYKTLQWSNVKLDCKVVLVLHDDGTGDKPDDELINMLSIF